jgi:hypothetical protein
MSAGSGVGPGSKTGAAAETMPGKQTTVHKSQIYAQQKMNVFKIECCGSYGQLLTEKQKVLDF